MGKEEATEPDREPDPRIDNPNLANDEVDVADGRGEGKGRCDGDAGAEPEVRTAELAGDAIPSISVKSSSLPKSLSCAATLSGERGSKTAPRGKFMRSA